MTMVIDAPVLLTTMLDDVVLTQNSSSDDTIVALQIEAENLSVSETVFTLKTKLGDRLKEQENSDPGLKPCICQDRQAWISSLRVLHPEKNGHYRVKDIIGSQ